MPITFSNAIILAQMELNMITSFSDRFILLYENAVETPTGWIFPWANHDYRATKDLTLGGNAPIFVDRFTGKASRVRQQ